MSGCNRIAGEDRPAVRGGTFTLERGARARGDDGRWPQSGPDDAQLALEAARAALDEWGAWGADTRARSLELALSELGQALADADSVGPHFGLEAEEIAAVHRADVAAVADALRHASPEPRPAGVSVLLPHWSELHRGIGLAVAHELLAGRCVVVVPDRRLPQLATPWLRCFDALGLPPGVVGVLHGPNRELVGALLDDPSVVAVRAAGSEARLADVNRLVRNRDGGATETTLEPVAKTGCYVKNGADVQAEAERIARAAVGRVETLGGQRGGQLGRIVCSEERFSQLTDALLGVLASGAPWAAPLGLVDREAADAVRATWELGLDEGATPIHGAEPGTSDRRCLEPIVFTNVEPTMQLARLRDPQPVLCLLRAGPSVPGDELVAELG